MRLLAGFGLLLIGSGQGALMLPALLAGSLAIGRTDWGRRAATPAGGIAALNAVAILAPLSVLPWWQMIIGWLLMWGSPLIDIGLALNLQPLGDGWQLSTRGWVITLCLGGSAGVGILVLAMSGV